MCRVRLGRAHDAAHGMIPAGEARRAQPLFQLRLERRALPTHHRGRLEIREQPATDPREHRSAERGRLGKVRPVDRHVQHIGEVLRESLARAVLVSIEDAGHFMLSTHPQELSNIIAGHVLMGGARASRPHS